MADTVQWSSGGIAGRIVRAAGAQGINQFARIVQLFLLVPICLTAWGTAVYEDWLLLNSITGFLVLADCGFVQFTTVKLIDARSKGEYERLSREWGVALTIFASLALALLCALAVLWLDPAWTFVVPTRQFAASELVSVTLLLSLAQTCTILTNLGVATYRAHGDLSRSYHISSVLVALQTAGVAIPAWLGAGPTAAAAGYCAATAMMLVAIIGDHRLRYRTVAWKPIRPSFAELRARFRDAIGYLASPVATTIMLNAPNLILAQAGAPEGAIALFSTTRTVAGVARQLPYQFAHPAGVELAALLARGDRAALSRVYESASRALAIVVGVLSGGTLVVAPLVLTLWTRGKIPYDPVLMLLLVGATAICAPAQIAYTFLWYGGYPGRLNKALFLSTGLAMALALALAPWFGPRGVATGTGAGEIVGIAIYLSLAVDRLLGRGARGALARNLLNTVLAFSSSAALGYLLYRLIAPHDWLGLIAFGAAWSAPVAAGLYAFLLNGSQKARIWSAATSFLRLHRA